MAPDYFAHSLPDKPKDKWQRLEEHLKNVAERAGGCGGVWDGSDTQRCDVTLEGSMNKARAHIRTPGCRGRMAENWRRPRKAAPFWCSWLE